VEETSRKKGFISVSLFARTATLRGDGSDAIHSPVDVEINRLWRRLEVLTKHLETLIANVALRMGENSNS
jgi:hypothetical protein